MKVEVAVRDQLFDWVVGLGDGIVIRKTNRVIKPTQELIRRLSSMY